MNPIDQIMERASAKLMAMEYLACEALCEEAMAMARSAGDFDRYARILLPLQEARRQRRQAAVDAGVVVLNGPRMSADEILRTHKQGCLMLIGPPYAADDEKAVRNLARERGLLLEVVVMDGSALRACFEQQMEREGDAAVAAVALGLPVEQEVRAMEQVLERVGDHEIAHQRLAAAAGRAAKRA